jgi:uncharacterized membrane protein
MKKLLLAASAALLNSISPPIFSDTPVPGEFAFSKFQVPNFSTLGVEDLNDVGQIVGYDDTSTGSIQGFLRSRAGNVSTLKDPLNTDGRYTQANGINDGGTVVGIYFDNAHSQYSGFFYAGGAYTTYNVPGLPPFSETDIWGINEFGDFCGDYRPAPAYNYVPFLNERGAITTFVIAGATIQQCLAINTRGVSAGSYYDGTTNHGFIRSAHGKIKVIDVPGAAFAGTVLIGLNDHGWTSGHFWDASNHEHGFLRSPRGKFYRIDVPGASTTTPGKGTAGGGLNDHCIVVGHFDPASGPLEQGYIARPEDDDHFTCDDEENE